MSELKKRVEEGLQGKYEGLNNGFSDLNNYIFGIQKKCYTLIGGLSGTFKTTLVDYMVSNAIEDAQNKGIPIDVLYYSFEIDKLTKQCNWLSQLAFRKYNVEIPSEKIKGLGNYRLNSEEQRIIDKLIPEVEKMFNDIKFTFDAVNPTGIFNDVFKHCEQLGEFTYSEYTNEKGEKKKRIESFKYTDDRYVIVAIDHLYLTKKERSFSTKENMDKTSEYLVYLRNIFSISPIVVQQFNQGLTAVDRAKFKGVDLSPQQTDFKDTTNPYQDADVVLGIINPFKLDMFKYQGYDTEKLRDRFVSLKIIKNRLSRDNIAKGLYAHPKSGRFEELPIPSKIDYNKYK